MLRDLLLDEEAGNLRVGHQPMCGTDVMPANKDIIANLQVAAGHRFLSSCSHPVTSVLPVPENTVVNPCVAVGQVSLSPMLEGEGSIPVWDVGFSPL